ncbi:long-chain-fatty-acid--CoA ligase [Thiobaca trueperi]|uniref:Long-chain acyl-CoA synthetase n=1 Tax=Thiobaca trueperi TaxID=127458 RepID=A0A4R3MX92_9GAMM|nr:long-chain fatty acid--CoA ligase [Thiobaca trueperi]TCT20151.1 long-chain acyl-CoA synthetase [Thiobaca trueperi]
MTSSRTLPQLFRHTAKCFAGTPAILTQERTWTYADLDDASDGMAAGLIARGIAPGERVGLYCPNGAEFVCCYLGILKAGACVVPINLLLPPTAIAFVLNDAGARAICFHAAFAEQTAAALAETPGVTVRVGIGPVAPEMVDCRLDDLTMAAAPPAPRIDPDQDPAVILYTSGTTGRPKGAVLTHANLAANATAVAEVLAVRPGADGDRLLVVLPMFHAFAATVGILTPLLVGAALVPVARFDSDLIAEAIGTHRATIFLGVPSLYAVLLRLDDTQVARWGSVRLCVSGGAAMPEAVMQAFETRFAVPVLEGDGPTECGPVTCVNRPAGPRKPRSVGPALPGVEMRIADSNGHWLPDGEHGEVCVRGPSVMRGYWNLPDETQASFYGDWFRTGDLGWRDPDGWFYLVDRIKDLIITNGMNVYPRIIEEVLIRHPDVAEVAVVGEPHPLHGEIPVAYVTAAPGHDDLDLRALKAWCRSRLGRHELPRRIERIDALPKNAAGKILKRELRRAGEHERGVRVP